MSHLQLLSDIENNGMYVMYVCFMQMYLIYICIYVMYVCMYLSIAWCYKEATSRTTYICDSYSDHVIQIHAIMKCVIWRFQCI